MTDTSTISSIPFRPSEKYMRRAIELARLGILHTSPNPNVGAVIVAPDGRIIGEGWHRRCGGPHAEVNAIASVKEEDEYLLPYSTIYVTLEPCSHYGKTPPCSKLLIEKRIPRVVIGMVDPFAKVSGNGIKMLREAGAEIITGFMEEEYMALNRRFITAHTLHRPYIQLKWAQSADGFIASIIDGVKQPVKLSNKISLCLMHKERALADAIMVGNTTLEIDNPSLTTRHWQGDSPRPVLFKTSRIDKSSPLSERNPILLDSGKSLKENMNHLYREYGITSLMVEGGAKLLNSFLEAGLADEIRVEVSPKIIKDGVPAPAVPCGYSRIHCINVGNNTITTYHPTHTLLDQS